MSAEEEVAVDETVLGRVTNHCSDDDGVPDVGISLGLGSGSALWLGELLKDDGGDIGFVFHGPDRLRIAAAIWPACEWRDVAELLSNHVAPLLARLTSTTPTGERGGRALFEHEMRQRGITGEDADWANVDSDERALWTASANAVLSAAPASPILTSVNGAGEREALRMSPEWCLRMAEREAEHGGEIGAGTIDHPLRLKCERAAPGWTCTRQPGHDGPCAAIALSPALDNTAVEGQRERIARAHARHLGAVAWWWGKPFDDGADKQAARLREQDMAAADDIIAALTAETEKAHG